MPTISHKEITELNALFGDMVKAAVQIKNQDPRFEAICEQIEKHGQTAYTKLCEILDRPN